LEPPYCSSPKNFGALLHPTRRNVKQKQSFPVEQKIKTVKQKEKAKKLFFQKGIKNSKNRLHAKDTVREILNRKSITTISMRTNYAKFLMDYRCLLTRGYVTGTRVGA